MKIIVSNVRLPLAYDEAALTRATARTAGLGADEITDCKLLKRSLDARKKNDIHFLAQVETIVKDASFRRALLAKGANVKTAEEERIEPLRVRKDPIPGRVVVVGLGPAGLFAGRELAAYGFSPLVIERGRPIERRAVDVNHYWETGELDMESNVMFGEGGAGTFSDGKLTSRSKDPRSGRVLELLHQAGAEENILYEAKPHIGTDRLREIVKSLREEIVALGGEVRFETRLTAIKTENGQLTGVTLQSGDTEEQIETRNLILAIGQGARDTVRMLHQSSVQITKKPFAAGVRIEHPQTLINRAQFGDEAENPLLGAAEYRLTAEVGGRGVYSFCMCPGGYVVASASGPEQVVVNGMSNALRDGKNANAALVVQVRPEDTPEGDLGGIEFCEDLERAAFIAGGGNGKAPAERLCDFLAHREPQALGGVQATYRPGVVPCDLWKVLPDFMAKSLSEALPPFCRQIRGFALDDAVLTAVESRTSAPYRIERGPNLESVSVKGLYPVGEGSGYAGGIVSSAIDGLRAAEEIIVGNKCDELHEN